jgi:hypothetical protein
MLSTLLTKFTEVNSGLPTNVITLSLYHSERETKEQRNGTLNIATRKKKHVYGKHNCMFQEFVSSPLPTEQYSLWWKLMFNQVMVFWVLHHVVQWICSNVSEKRTAYIFTVNEFGSDGSFIIPQYPPETNRVTLKTETTSFSRTQEQFKFTGPSPGTIWLRVAKVLSARRRLVLLYLP